MVRLYNSPVEKVGEHGRGGTLSNQTLVLSSEQTKEIQCRDSQVYLLYNVYNVNLRGGWTSVGRQIH